MDKFAYWTLKVMTYVFMLSAVAVIIMWIAEEDSYYHENTSWIIWMSAIVTSLFFAATSHVLARIIEQYIPKESDEYDEFEESDA